MASHATGVEQRSRLRDVTVPLSMIEEVVHFEKDAEISARRTRRLVIIGGSTIAGITLIAILSTAIAKNMDVY
jgi:hypothetical protein